MSDMPVNRMKAYFAALATANTQAPWRAMDDLLHWLTRAVNTLTELVAMR